MKENFNETMRWLHTYSGLIVGWLFFAIFVTGTSAYYKNEITLWMQPEFHKSKQNDKTLDIAINKAIEKIERNDKVSVTLPNNRSNLITVRFENSNNKKQTNKRKRRVPPTYYDASNGKKIKETTKTAGGNFLYRFHFELFEVPRSVGRWIVAIATMSMFVAIITGILIHKKIFKDIFTFRPKNNTRGWMDAHILPAVAALPFLIMITYSGLILLTGTIMPWGIKAYFGDNFRAYKQEYIKLYSVDNKELEAKRVILKNKEVENKANIYSAVNSNSLRQANYINSNSKRLAFIKAKRQLHNYEYIETKNIITKETLNLIIKKANEIWPNNIGSFTIIKEKNKNPIIEVSPRVATTLFNYKMQREVATYDAKSLTLLDSSILPSLESKVLNTSTTLRALHEAKFADSTLRFIFFVSGILGIILIGTGLVLWTQKRKKKNALKKSFGFWLVEKLNLGTIVGIMLALTIYFIANRVISFDEVNRKDLEINAFFLAWLFSYIHAFLRDTNKAWKEQLLLTAILFLSLPIINAITVLETFLEVFTRDSIFIYFDIFFIFMALVSLLIRFILIRKERRKA
ncbi:MAG: PepSY domain-containing protein [Campylobacteraceae bacterium]|nr:PepSY domain-containing protein [Campylobacteraceae bacterium]